MSHVPARRGERKMITVGSVWTDGHTDVRVVTVQEFDKYRYVTYRIDGFKKKTVGPIDDHTFVLKFTAKVVRQAEVKTLEPLPKDENEGKVKMVGWAG